MNCFCNSFTLILNEILNEQNSNSNLLIFLNNKRSICSRIPHVERVERSRLDIDQDHYDLQEVSETGYEIARVLLKIYNFQTLFHSTDRNL